MGKKLTLEQFVERYSGAPFDDDECASVIIDKLPEGLPVVKAAHGLLEARRMFDAALESAGIERG